MLQHPIELAADTHRHIRLFPLPTLAEEKAYSYDAFLANNSLRQNKCGDVSFDKLKPLGST
jgi:hypothetical protein